MFKYWCFTCSSFRKFLDKIFDQIYLNPLSKIKIDLKGQTIKILDSNNMEKFQINDYKKSNMLNGFDDIDYLINIKESIMKFEKNNPL